MRRHATYWAILLVYFATIMGSAWYVDRALETRRTEQVAACNRGNIIRADSRALQSNVKKIARILGDFLGDAVVARSASGTPTDLAAAKKYAQSLALLNAVDFKPVEIVNCETSIK